LLRDLEDAKANVQVLNERLEKVEVEKKKLVENCKILI
jgi:predicted nuclease with TOPRIM domain